MPITVYESHASRNLEVTESGTGYELLFVVTGTQDAGEAANAVLLATSPTLFGMVRKSIKPREVAAGFWNVGLSYSPGNINEALQAPLGEGTGPETTTPEPSGSDPVDDNISVSFGGGQTHILQSLITRAMYKRGVAEPVAPDNDRAIGLTDDGVEGCDVVVPQITFSIPRKRRVITWDYFRKICRMVGKTNDGDFRGYKRGELLYLPPSISGNLRTGWDIQHNFGFNEDQPENDPRNEVSPSITLRDGKRGWDYVWFRYKPKIVDGAKVSRPVAAYVEKVYDEANFGDLEL
ncbi:hypothetical protein J0H58_21590 [bacterium]|nr:hypothetical protein [bacterium]